MHWILHSLRGVSAETHVYSPSLRYSSITYNDLYSHLQPPPILVERGARQYFDDLLVSLHWLTHDDHNPASATLIQRVAPFALQVPSPSPEHTP